MTSTASPPGSLARPAAPTWLPATAVAVTLLLWASAFVAIRHLGHDFSPGALSLGRLVVASLCLGGVVVASRRSTASVRPNAREWVSIVVIGVLWFGVYNVALNAGERRIDAGTAAMLIQVSPILIAALAATFLSERFTPQLGMGLALAFGGVVVIASATSPGGDRDLAGVGLCLLSAVAYSVSLVLQKPLVVRLSAVQVVWLACTVGMLACLPFAGQLVGEVAEAGAGATWWLVYLGVFPTAVAFTTYAYALRAMTAGSLGVTTYLVPPITILLGLLFLDETPPAVAYLGGALALVGVAVARRTSHPPAPRDEITAGETASGG